MPYAIRARRRVLTCYDEDGQLVGDRTLAVPVADLQRMFGRDADDEMLGAYAVGAVQAEALAPLLGEALDVQAWTYFVEAWDSEAG